MKLNVNLSGYLIMLEKTLCGVNILTVNSAKDFICSLTVLLWSSYQKTRLQGIYQN